MNIRIKFRYTFVLLLSLMALVASISIIALVDNRRRTETTIVTSTEIQRLVLEMDRHLETARRLELDFFTKYPQLGFDDAEETYISEALNHIEIGISLSVELEQILSQSILEEAWQESQVNLSLYLSTANRHAVIVNETFDLVSQLAEDETGLESQLEQHALHLGEIIQQSGDSGLIQLFLEMRVYEMDYLLSRQRPSMQSAMNKSSTLSNRLLYTPALSQEQKGQALSYLEAYLSGVREILQIDVDIRSKRNEIDLQTQIVDQITNELVALTNLEILKARQEIFRLNTLVISLLIIVSGFGVIITSLVLNRLNSSITQSITKLTDSALELQAGNLDERVIIENKDELGILAESFNSMAAQISTLIGGLEDEVEKRTVELLAERNKAQHYLDVAGVLFMVLDQDQRIILINKKGCELLGGEESEILGLDWFDNFIPEDQVEEGKSVFDQIIAGNLELAEYYENEIIRIDGEKRFFAWHNAILTDKNGALSGVLCSGEDITERAQAQIAQQEAYQQVISRQAAVLNLTEDLRHEIVERKNAELLINQQNQFLIALQTTTLELLSELDLDTLLENIVSRAAQISNTTAGFLGLVDPDSGKLIPQVGIGALEESLLYQIQKGEGVAGTVWETGKPVIIDDYDQWDQRVEKFSTNSLRSIIGVPLLSSGQVIGVIGLGHDASTRNSFSEDAVDYMTQFAQLASIAIENARLYSSAKTELEIRKKTEQEREKLVLELEAKNRELETFVYTVSHDLKSPLVSISGFSAILKNRYLEKFDERGNHYLNRLQSNVAHMEALINELLELSRVGRVVGELIPISLSSLLDNILETMSGDLESSNTEVVIKSDLPTVRGDHVRLGQVFTNLLDNAIKFRHPERNPHIEISCQENLLDYTTSISDNGIGIDTRYANKLFIPFQKLNTDSEGMGIGLALVSRIIEFHGGKLWFESSVGEGTTFYFTLPKDNKEEPDDK